MCGIAGLLQFNPGLAPRELEARALAMSGAIAHRGPDADGVWSHAACGVALAHRRLSIIDLSPAGAQPMASHSGRFVTVFNGEIYNYEELRAGLPPTAWRGHSDTEVLLEAIETWGLTAALKRAVGMFSIALWDAKERVLTLARDRLGEKPLYYGVAGGALLFGSELKALMAVPGWSGEIDRTALDAYMRHAAVPAPRSIYHNVKKLPAACCLRISLRDAARVLELAPEPYWSLEAVAAQPALQLEDAEAIDQLEILLKQAIAGQMVADVPVGAFLSGGVDSSAIVALMQAQSARPVRTFSIGFNEAGYNEAEHAKAVAGHLGTHHTELYVTPDEARAVIPLLPRMFDEPFADSSQIPTYLVAKLARTHVTVSLSGDGGDELFGGYNRYVWADKYWKPMNGMPDFVRALAGAGVHALSPRAWDSLWKILPRRVQMAQPGDKLYKVADLMQARDGRQAYAWLTAQYRERESLVLGVAEGLPAGEHALWSAAGRSLADNMMLADARGYLADDILAKVDRATMAVGLEGRAPFLDHRVAEFAFRLPIEQKIHNGVGKWLLKQVLYRHVPAALIERPKMGFGVPIDSWLRGPLKLWAEELLDPVRLRNEGFLRVEAVRRAWDEHQSGRRNQQHFLWNVLMFEAWLNQGKFP
ncbi:MAG: asparagine synthetase [Betaproteobacteria bacterium]|nr:asparagine synthetase [Betaproteobacteria bacterium]